MREASGHARRGGAAQGMDSGRERVTRWLARTASSADSGVAGKEFHEHRESYASIGFGILMSRPHKTNGFLIIILEIHKTYGFLVVMQIYGVV